MKCKSKFAKQTSYSPSLSVQETTGRAKDVKDDMSRQHKLYTVAIFGDEGERTLALTKIMLTHCVTAVINYGDMETVEKTILRLKRNSLAKQGIKTFKFVHLPTEKKTTN